MTSLAFENLPLSEQTKLTIETLDAAHRAIAKGDYGDALRLAGYLEEISQRSDDELSSSARDGAEAINAACVAVREYTDALITHLDQVLEGRHLYKFDDLPLHARATLTWSALRCIRQMIQLKARPQVLQLLSLINEISAYSTGATVRMCEGAADTAVAYLAPPQRESLPNGPPEPAPPPPVDEKALDAAREEGRTAATTGKRVIDNPYISNDPRRAAWDEGWCAQSGNDGMDIPDAWRRKEKSKKKPKKDDAGDA